MRALCVNNRNERQEYRRKMENKFGRKKGKAVEELKVSACEGKMK